MYENCFENLKFVWQLPEKRFYQNSGYEVHQVGPKNSSSQNFNFQLHDRKLVLQRRGIDGIFFGSKHGFLGFKSPKS
jgi:hypothetical protein